jgi:hypothetical protein
MPSLFWWSKNPFTKPRRSFPVDFNYSVTISDVMDLECDEGLTVAAAPQDMSETMDGISFARSVLQADHNARIMSQMIISKPVFLPALYSKLRGLFTKMGDAAAEPVTITY